MNWTTAVWGCLELWQLGDGERQREREIDFICHWSSLQQYASLTFKMALKYSKLREFPCSWVGVDRLSGSIRKRQRKADVYIVSSNNNVLPLRHLPLRRIRLFVVRCVCVGKRASEGNRRGIFLTPLVRRARFHPSHLGKPKRRILSLPRSPRKLVLWPGGGGGTEPRCPDSSLVVGH